MFFRLLVTNIYDTLHKINTAEVCLLRRKKVCREPILEMLPSPLLCAGLTNSRAVVLLLLLCSEKKSLVYLFSHFSCVLTPSKATRSVGAGEGGGFSFSPMVMNSAQLPRKPLE